MIENPPSTKLFNPKFGHVTICQYAIIISNADDNIQQLTCEQNKHNHCLYCYYCIPIIKVLTINHVIKTVILDIDV